MDPTVPPPYPIHVMAQQILAVLLQHRALSQDRLLALVAGLPEASGILTHMREIGFVSQDGPFLMLGPEAERVYGRRNYMGLLSVFDTPELYAVQYGPAELGSVHELSLRTRE